MYEYKFAHFSDTHWEGNDAEQFISDLGRHEVKERLAKTLAGLESLDFILLTGDIVHEGTAKDYRDLRYVFDTHAPGVPLFCSMGNHDRRQAFGKGFLGENFSDEPYLYVKHFKDLRLVCLDSAYDYGKRGYISAFQRDWLRQVLSVPYGCGTILLTHHPFISLDLPALAEVDEEFLQAIRGSDIIGFFNGHIHSNAHILYEGRPHITAESMAFGIERIGDDVVYSTRTGYNLCYVKDKKIDVATKIVPAHFAQLRRRSLR